MWTAAATGGGRRYDNHRILCPDIRRFGALDSINALMARAKSNKRLVVVQAGAICVLQLIANVFPASDFVHPVVTPALLVGSALLAQSRVRSSADV